MTDIHMQILEPDNPGSGGGEPLSYQGHFTFSKQALTLVIKPW